MALAWTLTWVVPVLDTATPFLQSLPASELQQASLGYGVLLWSFFQVMTGNYQAKIPSSGFSNHLVNAISNPVLFAELHLLAARQSRLRFCLGSGSVAYSGWSSEWMDGSMWSAREPKGRE